MLIVASYAQKNPAEKTILGMGTDYLFMPETMKGKVKEVKELNYWASEKNGKITKGNLMTWKELDSIGSTKNFVAYFDNTGVLTKYDNLDENNAIRNSNIGTIENGKWKRFESKTKDSISSYWIPQYDNMGYLIGGSSYRPIKDTLIVRQVFTHDGKGNYTKYEYFNSKNKRTAYQVISLNANGKVNEVKYFNKNDSLTGSLINTYNDKGFLIKQLSSSEKPKSTSPWIYKDLKFDDHGNWLECFAVIDNGKYKVLATRSYTYY